MSEKTRIDLKALILVFDKQFLVKFDLVCGLVKLKFGLVQSKMYDQYAVQLKSRVLQIWFRPNLCVVSSSVSVLNFCNHSFELLPIPLLVCLASRD